MLFVLCIYTSCKKTQVGSNTQAVNAEALSKQIALNLYKTISGQYGGTNIANGIKAPASLTKPGKGLRINDFNPYCGYTIDTTYNTNVIVNDTTETTAGHFKFVYGCSTGSIDSYTVADSVTNTYTGALFANSFNVSQNYFVQALNSNYSLVSMVGYITSSSYTSTISSTTHLVTNSNTLNTQYGLNNVQVDVSTGIANITTGTANFYAQTLSIDPNNTAGVAGGYSGTITFLGNFLATLSLNINNGISTYSINMLTGVITPV
jgi:hypothetical protein